jgi:hypothetical protein
MKKDELTLESLLRIYRTIPAARQKILEATGVDIPYDTLNYWTKGRFDILSIERAIAIKQCFRLSDEELLRILRNSKK